MLGKAVSDINKDGEPDVTESRVTILAFETFFGQKSFTLIVI
jgi:hypothetical protein